MILVFSPFAHTKKLIKETLNIDVSETTLKILSSRIGTRLYNNMEKKSKRPEQVQSKAPKSANVMYIQADGAMTPIATTGGVEYKENKLGIVFTDDNIIRKKTKKDGDRIEIKNKHFISSVGEGVDKFKKLLHVAAKENGSYKPAQQVLICDGASWLSKMKEEYFPDAIQILDWYHAVDHLWQTAHSLFGENNNDQCRSWVEPQKQLLWEGKIDDVISGLIKEENIAKKNQDSIWQLHGYFVSNRNNMRYDEYRAAGYYIGSGAIESANKYIVANRLKQAGMRWEIKNANAIIWLRSKYFEDDWDAFWESMNIGDYKGPQELLWGAEKSA
jgi:putative ubiquitin-RnfH superfamily antitoxin RatB of RatAB toxin-antitoxin module